MRSGQTTGLALMERAGAAVVGHIRLRWPKPGFATVLCGPGNNGGDGYVIARLLKQAGWQVRALGSDKTPGPDAAEMRDRWLGIGSKTPLTMAELQNGPASDLYIDAIFGTGLSRPPHGEIADILAHMARKAEIRERLVAVDCPSGLCMDSGALLGRPRSGSESALPARLTVSFDSPKSGHFLELGPQLCGELVVADIGLRHWRETDRAIRLSALSPAFGIKDRCCPDNPLARIDKAPQSHKFNHGHALVIAGGAGRGGAARLSARAALRAGAGLVTICPPADAMSEHYGPPDALMRRPLDDAGQLQDMLGDHRITAVCIGPGTGLIRAAQLLPAVLESGRPCVLDADTLTAMAGDNRLTAGLHDNCLLTPHAGEFTRLFPDIAARLADTPKQGPAFSKVDAAREAAARLGVCVLLKGPDTVIAAPDGRAYIHSAFDVPWLATAGSGDVLAGIAAGLLARGFPVADAAGLGAALHTMAARRFGPGLIADDLPEELPKLFAT